MITFVAGKTAACLGAIFLGSTASLFLCIGIYAIIRWQTEGHVRKYGRLTIKEAREKSLWTKYFIKVHNFYYMYLYKLHNFLADISGGVAFLSFFLMMTAIILSPLIGPG